jgi:hypothetical protein
MDRVLDTSQTILNPLERLMILADKVQAMRTLQRKRMGAGVDENEWVRLGELESAVDAFFMLPEIPRAVAQ